MQNDWTLSVKQVLRHYLALGSKILVAVSGGPDSVALAHLLKGSPYRMMIGHVDHQLRSGSSKDAQFVRKLAKEWDIPCVVKRVDVKRYAKRHAMGIEEAARNLRYQALGSMAQKYRCSAIVTAHTAGDQAETVLMNFLRGAGPAGLAGIPVHRAFNSRRGVAIIRPLLNVHRNQIMSYLQHHSVASRQDPTNQSLRFARNRIRHSTLPYLEKMAPGLSERLIQTADLFRQEEEFWRTIILKEARKVTQKNDHGTTVVLPRLLGYHKALSRRILRHVFPGLSFRDIESKLSEIQKRNK